MNEVHSLSITEFCDRFGACQHGREWAVANCQDMAEVWNLIQPNWLVWVATRSGVLSSRDLRLFACFCARQNWHLLRDRQSRNAVEVAERYFRGEATDDELSAASAWAAEAEAEAWADASWAAAASAASSAACAASAEAEAWADASLAAEAAAWAAWAAAEADAAARLATRASQAEYLRVLDNPFRGRESCNQ